MRLLIATVATLVLSLVLAVTYPDVMIKPGQLSEGHRSLDRDCLRCHALAQGASAANCLRCHHLVDIGRRTTAGAPLPATGSRKVAFHASLANTDCMECHTVHASARHRQEVVFQHDLLAVADRQNCGACHQQDRPEDELHRQGSDSCGTCHGTRAWRPATFDHARYFRFDANHPADCRVCHTDSRSFAAYTCYGCHEHAPARIAAEHREEGISNFEDCARCHRSGEEDEAEGRGRREGRGEDDEDD
ncbi:MAG TPA: class III cytochrome C family protein [Thermoanaerobaculia bacterium]